MRSVEDWIVPEAFKSDIDRAVKILQNVFEILDDPHLIASRIDRRGLLLDHGWDG